MSDLEVKFDFCVYPISIEQAGELFDKFVELAEEMNVNLGGGYHEYQEEEDAKANETTLQ